MGGCGDAVGQFAEVTEGGEATSAVAVPPLLRKGRGEEQEEGKEGCIRGVGKAGEPVGWWWIAEEVSPGFRVVAFL